MKKLKPLHLALCLGMILPFVAIPSLSAKEPLPPLVENYVYVFGLPGGTEMECFVLDQPVGQWVRCKNKLTGKEIWLNLATVLYIKGIRSN